MYIARVVMAIVPTDHDEAKTRHLSFSTSPFVLTAATRHDTQNGSKLFLTAISQDTSPAVAVIRFGAPNTMPFHAHAHIYSYIRLLVTDSVIRIWQIQVPICPLLSQNHHTNHSS